MIPAKFLFLFSVTCFLGVLLTLLWSTPHSDLREEISHNRVSITTLNNQIAELKLQLSRIQTPPSSDVLKVQQSDASLLGIARGFQEKIQQVDRKAEYGYYFKHDLELLHKHARDGTIWLISTNKGMLPYAYNLLCSVAKFNVSLIDHIVFHAVDYEAKLALEDHRMRQHWYFNQSSNNVPTWGSNMGYGILYNPLFSGPSEITHINEPNYWKIMKQRPSFFLTLLRSMQVNFIFSDADIVYFRDPLQFVTDRTIAGDADFVISTDARNVFTELEDLRYTWPGRTIPSFCGGFFFSRSNARTIGFFERLETFLEQDPLTNDQTGFERIMDNSPVKLVGRLPRGLSTKQGTNSDVLAANRTILPAIVRSQDAGPDTEPDDTSLSVHILDQIQFLSGAVYENYGPERWEAESAGLEGMDARVMKHGNFPGYEKLDKFKRYGWWLLDWDNQSCPK